MNKGISIIICTYNGKERLVETLTHLTNQKLNVACEIILVDNASIDGTKDFADTWWSENGHIGIDYVSYIQPKAGKQYAQELGYEKAKYNYLLVCDDDNSLCNTYVQTAFAVMESDSSIGALGGWCEATFETEKPDWFNQYAKYFAVSKQGIESGDVTNKKGCLYGAGMVLRKTHWQQLNTLGFKPLLTCRKGDTLSSGGDTEYCYALRLLGYKIWYDERLYFKHHMPKGRMSLDYVSRLRKAMTESNFVVSVYTDELSNKTVNQKVFYQRFLKEVRYKLKANSRKIFFGNFEEKQQAKIYFRNLKYMLFSFKTYSNNRTSIYKWLPKNNSL